MKRLLFFVIMVMFVLAGCGTENDEAKSADKDSDKSKATSKMKKFKIGQAVDADGVQVKLTKIEYVNDYDEYSAPENGKVIKVYLKFKNNNEDQVLMDSSDFSMKLNNENYQEWFGNDDTNAGFSHQLNKGNTGSGYITYDVPDSDNYTLEMDATPKFNNVKAKWEIKKTDIKEASVANSNESNDEAETDTNVESEDSEEPKITDEDSEDTESEETGYSAEMYNALVDEYNALTDGEKMNHVDDDVLEIEYDQLEARVDALYDKKMDEEDKALEEEMEQEDKALEEEMEQDEKEYEEEMEAIDKEYEEEMKKIEEEDTTDEDTSEDDAA